MAMLFRHISIPHLFCMAVKIFEAFNHHNAAASGENWGMLLLATAISAVVSFIAVKWLLRYIQTHTFSLFGWYRIALGIIIFLLMLR